MDIIQKRFAVLIDADNAQHSLIGPILEEVAKHGLASVKRVYGDWSSSSLKSWKKLSLDHSIQPIQQFAYTKRKNATDVALVIDAMDLLFAGNLDGFCIVSSDSDYTGLSMRLRESGMIVFGFGAEKTPAPFIQACNRFFFVENLEKASESEQLTDKAKKTRKKNPQQLKQDAKLINSIRKAIEESEDDDEGWVNMSSIGQIILNVYPQFDPRNYGYERLGELLRAIDLFEVQAIKKPSGIGKTLLVRDKKRTR